MTETKDNSAADALIDPGCDLRITKMTFRSSAPGAWVSGSLSGHRFQALVFRGHAGSEGYEIGDSRISKLWVQRLADKATVYNWDRGPDVPAADATVAAVVEFLAAGLAEYAYGE